jgi:chitin disaccharide deacetylase
MEGTRYLTVIADDFGIGPATSRGILDLAARGVITGTVLLVNSPYAPEAVRAWRRGGAALEVGWHPCLTMDPPVSRAGEVPSLVGPDGCLWPLRSFLPRLLAGLIRPREIEHELRAQYARFRELTGAPPGLVNSHQHVALFPPVGRLLCAVLAGCRPRPLLRRVREPWAMLARVPGARLKRAVLSCLGRVESRRQERAGLPGQEWLAGITDPPWVQDPDYFVRWLSQVPGRDVEVACHPGYRDLTLIGRDCGPDDGLLQRRVDELELLLRPSFPDACREAGFALVSPSEWLARRTEGVRHAA